MTRVPALAVAVSTLVLLAACGPTGPDTSPTDAEPPAAADPVGFGPSAPASPDSPPAAPETPAPPARGEQGGTDDWRAVASAEDESRIERLGQAWRLGRAEAEDRGFAAELAALGALADPDAGLPGRLQPPPGDYRCRMILLGSHDGAGLGFIPYGGFRCRVELTPGGDLILTKTTGSQRPRGLIYPDSDRRLVFVGAQAWGDGEEGWPAYGQMPERDMVGVVERIGDRRWRVVVPWPKQDAKLKLIELVG